MPYTEAINAITIHKNALLESVEDTDAPNNKAGLLATTAKLDDAIAFLKVSSFGGLTALVSLVRQWGVDKGITGPNAKATVESQFTKLLEEVDEVREGIEKKDQHELIDGIGDCTVVLILLADLAGVKFEQCLLAAWEEIKGRTGRMSKDGIFIKDA